MKPWGMDASFQIVRPTNAADKFFDAVEAAIDAGWTPDQAISEVAESWSICLREKEKLAVEQFSKARHG